MRQGLRDLFTPGTTGHVHNLSLAFTLALSLDMKFKQDPNLEGLVSLRMGLQFFDHEYVCRAWNTTLPGSDLRSRET